MGVPWLPVTLKVKLPPEHTKLDALFELRNPALAVEAKVAVRGVRDVLSQVVELL